MDEIQRAVCAHYRLDKSEMASKRRVRAIARPRQVAMYLAKELTPRSYPEIGRRFGGRDHSTVIHAVRTVEALRVADGELDAESAAIRRSLKSYRRVASAQGDGNKKPAIRWEGGSFADRKSVGYGTSVSVRVDLRCRRIIKKKT